jgi:uncharacterized membrane protein
MTLIDHRQLVNAPPEVIWQLLSDLAALPKWHVNCTQSSILTTQQYGTGTRRRNMMRGRPDTVEQIVSWYNNLGYEYVIVDGVPYPQNRGRIRLQAIPEGTIVQWTFEYEMQGFFGRLRDRLSIRRRLNNEMAASLKRLKKLVESTGITMDSITRERVAMRAAPSASERAALGRAAAARTQPSMPAIPPEDVLTDVPAAAPVDTPAQAPVVMPSVEPVVPAGPVIDEGDVPGVEATKPPVIDEGDLPPIPGIVEPPLDDEDTRPNPALTEAAPPDAPAPVHDTPITEPRFDAVPAEATPTAEPTPADDNDTPTEPKRPEELAAALELDPPERESFTPEPIDYLAMAPEPALPLDDEPPTEPQLEAIQVEPPAPDPVPDTPARAEETDQPDSQTAPTVATPAVEPPSAAPVESAPMESVPLEAAPLESAQDTAATSDPVGPSIWEVFGMKAPSEDAAPAPSPATESASPLPTSVEAEPPAAIVRSAHYAPRETRRHAGWRSEQRQQRQRTHPRQA